MWIYLFPLHFSFTKRYHDFDAACDFTTGTYPLKKLYVGRQMEHVRCRLFLEFERGLVYFMFSFFSFFVLDIRYPIQHEIGLLENEGFWGWGSRMARPSEIRQEYTVILDPRTRLIRCLTCV